MTKLTKTVLESGAALVLGLAVIGSLVFALAHSAEAHNKGAKAAGSPLEVMIHDDGRAIVRGAEVTNVSGGTITARTDWGQSAIVWNVRTDGDTQFIQKNGSSDELNDIDVGEYVSFSGVIDGTGTTFAVDADAVKNWSADDDHTKNEDHTAALEARAEARAEAKADMKGRWDKLKERFRTFNPFGRN